MLSKTVPPSPTRILTFDLGGSHVSSAFFDGGKTFLPRRVASEPLLSEDRDDLLEAIQRCGSLALSQLANVSAQPEAVVMAAPGPFDYDTGVSRMRHKHAGLWGCSLKQHLATAFNVDPGQVSFLNDADAFLLGELQGTASQQERVIGITLGTGVGSALAVSGTIRRTGSKIPASGEIWNLPWGEGTLEDYISTRALLREYRAGGGEVETVKEMAAKAREEPLVRAVFRQFGETLGRALACYADDFDPTGLVLGGAIAGSAPLFFPALATALLPLQPLIFRSEFGSAAPLMGARRFAERQ